MNEHGCILASFEWGLGSLSNNRAEAYTLFKGLQIIKNLNLQNVMIFSDSAIIVNMMINIKKTPNISLSRLIDRWRILSKDMEDLSFFHILKENIKQADILANKACSRPVGQLFYQDGTSFSPLP